jgi:hypothetical protein
MIRRPEMMMANDGEDGDGRVEKKKSVYGITAPFDR